MSSDGVSNALQVGDLVSLEDSIVWIPSEEFEGNKKLLTFKAINNQQLLSATSASLYVNLT